MKNEFLAFQYLQKAAEHAVEDLSSLSSTVNMSAAKSELIMAIYELGVSFRHGWGVRVISVVIFIYILTILHSARRIRKLRFIISR